MMDRIATGPRRRRVAGPVRVLIADDHELTRIALQGALSAAGMRVVAACANGAEAVAAAARLHPDVVLMDLLMPLMDGAEATRRIVADAPDTRVVVLTAAGPGPLLQAAMDAGAAGYVFKDAGMDAVIAAIGAQPRRI